MRIIKFVAELLVVLGAAACILTWLEIKPGDFVMVTVPHVLWLILGILLFALSLSSSGYSLHKSYRLTDSKGSAAELARLNKQLNDEIGAKMLAHGTLEQLQKRFDELQGLTKEREATINRLTQHPPVVPTRVPDIKMSAHVVKLLGAFPHGDSLGTRVHCEFGVGFSMYNPSDVAIKIESLTVFAVGPRAVRCISMEGYEPSFSVLSKTSSSLQATARIEFDADESNTIPNCLIFRAIDEFGAKHETQITDIPNLPAPSASASEAI